VTRLLAFASALVAALAAACSTSPSSPTYADRATMLDPQSCKTCHADHYGDWARSMHAYASDDPVFRAMNARGQRETGGQLGSFCVQCHAPMAVAENATKDGTNLDHVDAKLHGVTCFFCHSVDQVNGTHNDPLHLATDLAMRGPLSDAVSNAAHTSTYSSLHDRDQLASASMCGACHDIVNGHGAAIERTFAEWQASVFSHAPGGTTCGQCHMNESTTPEAIAQAPGAPATRRFHGHSFPAVDTALVPSFPGQDVLSHEVQTFLSTTLQSALCVGQQGGAFTLRVMLDNVAAGHSFPSGSSQDRRLFVEVIAKQAGNVLYQSGVVAPGTAPTTSPDADFWLLRDCMTDDAGKPVSMFWQASAYEGNELPGQATFDPTDMRFYQSHIEQTYPRSTASITGTPDTVTLRVLEQPIGLDVLDDLVGSGDLPQATRDAMQTIQVGTTLTWTPQTVNGTTIENGVMLQCITATNFNVKSQTVPATGHTKCAP
jgi:hypothetical protein